MTRPIQPPTTDQRLDRLMRQLLTERAEDVAADALPADAMAERIAARLRPSRFGRTWLLLAAALFTALLIGGTLAVGNAVWLPWLQLPAPTTSELPAPTTSEDEVVHGWPDTTENQPGVYSWAGTGCGLSCNLGFMHNGYGSGDVEIRLDVVPEGSISDDSATAVTVAGHEGIYRRIHAGREKWIVDIEGTTIAIRLTARPGASQADLDDAHAIIGSMRYQRQDNRRGFRLLFTLTNDEWDSG